MSRFMFVVVMACANVVSAQYQNVYNGGMDNSPLYTPGQVVPGYYSPTPTFAPNNYGQMYNNYPLAYNMPVQQNQQMMLVPVRQPEQMLYNMPMQQRQNESVINNVYVKVQPEPQRTYCQPQVCQPQTFWNGYSWQTNYPENCYLQRNNCCQATYPCYYNQQGCASYYYYQPWWRWFW